MDRIVRWNKFWDEMLKMPEKSRFQMFQKRFVAKELRECKKNFIKTGYMISPTKKYDENKIDNIAIRIATRDPVIEKKIEWVKFSEGKL